MSEVTPEGAVAEPVEASADEAGFVIDPQEWQQTQEQLQQLSQIVQPPPQPWQQSQPQGPPVPDPFAEDYQQQFQTYVEHLTQPLNEWRQQQELSAAQEQAMSTLDHLAETGGPFDRDMAWARANQLVLENGGDPNKALEQAAKDTREYERRVGEAYHQQQIAQLQGNAGARGPIPVGIGGTQTVSTGGLGNHPGAVTAKFFGPQIGSG